MKITIQTTIPTGRQYENIKTSYEGEESQRQALIEMAEEDCRKLHNCLINPKKVILNTEVEEISIISGVKFIKTNGKWSFVEPKEGGK